MGLFSKSSSYERENQDTNRQTDRNTNTTGATTGASDFTRSPIVPEQWRNDYNTFGDQYMRGDEGGLGAAQDQLAQINRTYGVRGADGESLPLNVLVEKYGYEAPQNVQAQQIAAQQGLNLSGGYENAYTDNVVNRTLDNYDVGTERSANAFRANSIAGGQGGNARQSVAAGVAAGEAARNRGMTEADLRFGAQDRAFGFGMQDANRYLSADAQNAGNALQADTFNQGRLDQRQMFDANMAEQGMRRRMDAVGNMEQNVLAQGMLANDRFNQGLGYLNTGTQMFGDQGRSNESSDFTQQQILDEMIQEEIDRDKMGIKSSVGFP